MSRYTWQDFELKEPSTRIMSWNGSKTSLFFFHSSSRSLRFPETSVFQEKPLSHFGDRCKSEEFSPGCERAEGVASLRDRTLSRILFIQFSYARCICFVHNISMISLLNLARDSTWSLCFCICRKRILWDRA